MNRPASQQDDEARRPAPPPERAASDRAANSDGFRWFPPSSEQQAAPEDLLGHAPPGESPTAAGGGGQGGFADAGRRAYADGAWGWDEGGPRSNYPGITQPLPARRDQHPSGSGEHGGVLRGWGASPAVPPAPDGGGRQPPTDDRYSQQADVPGAPVPGGARGPGEEAASGGLPARFDAAARAVEVLERRVDELARLRRHDADLVDRLHAENSRLRQGELIEAMAPLLRGLIRLHDQMTSLGGDDPQSVAGILRSQLLQILDVTVDVRPFTAVPGSPFDPARHLGVRGLPTDDPDRDRTVARTVKPGFVRGDSTVVRPAETEVYRAH